MTLAGRLQTWVAESLDALLAATVPLSHEIAIAAYELPGQFPRGDTCRDGGAAPDFGA